MNKITIQNILDYKKSGKPFATLTAYDYSSAKIVDLTGIPLILVGDSAAMVMLGYENTLPITMDEMLVFVKAVSRGTKYAIVIADMPFMSYQTSVEQALINAGRFVKEGKAGAVKLEGGERIIPQITATLAVALILVVAYAAPAPADMVDDWLAHKNAALEPAAFYPGSRFDFAAAG